ncbi:MAG: T9SS type A sorting domain-containing protein [Flavobacterium sp.]|nr:MAG: T9SS type A sorting domain-containing protein [Flavobacterium sp.]
MKKILLLGFALAAFSAQAQFWTQKATGFATASRGVGDISIVDANTVWISSYDGSGTASQTVKDLALSTDGGNTWTPIVANLGLGTGGLGISSVSAISATTAWVCAYPGTGGIPGVWQTTNGGTTWTKQATAAYSGSSFPNMIHFFDANNGVTMGDPLGGYFEVYTTPDGGTTWTRVPSANLPAPLSASEYGYTHNFVTAGNTIWFGTSAGRIFRSTDMGLTWTAGQTPSTDLGAAADGGAYSFSDATKGLLSLNNGSLYSTNDGGATWNPVIANGTAFSGDIAYVPGTSKVVSTGISATSAFGVGSSYSLDDGATWTTTDTAAQYGTVRFLNETTGFAGGFNTNATTGGIYKYTGTELPVAHFQSSQLQIYPNPSTGVYNLSGTPVSQVTVVDLLGKQVFNSKYSAVSDLTVDLSSLDRGVYMMSIKNDLGESKTVKIMKN